MKPVHLVTVVGGSVDALRHMLAHYRSMGIQPIFRNLHLSSDDDQVRDQVQTIAREDRQEKLVCPCFLPTVCPCFPPAPRKADPSLRSG
jgi:hypothetical protein